MSNFAFLKTEWPEPYEAASRAEAAALTDPRTACFYARRALEAVMAWLYKYDTKLKAPYQENLSAQIHEPTFKAVAGEAVFMKARLIQQQGNRAVHSAAPVRPFEGLLTVKELFHLTHWLAHTYARGAKPAADQAFDKSALPDTAPAPKQTLEQLRKLEDTLREKDGKLATLLSDSAEKDAELARLRAEVAEAKKANAAAPDTHDYSESQTRDFFIDLLLREAGWALDGPKDREFSVEGMPTPGGKGYVDYVLWGDDGLPLALVEAKRTRTSPGAGQQQAKLYADCLEQRFGRRPVIYYSNGYEHWMWDDTEHPPRAVQGFRKKAELDLMIQRRRTRKPTAEEPINPEIAGRYYQTRAIRRICEAFEKDRDRKALVVMATGAGKTRTVIALCDLLMRCNVVKRALFLADRVALVNQAVKAFKKHLPDASPVNLVTEKNSEGRVFLSTYPTMMGLIDESRDGERRFGPGHFDLVIIDEAHRSVFQKYRAIFSYFDSLLVGLTATPREEVDRNTYGLFDLEDGVPTDAYPLEEAVSDRYLVPPRAVSVPLRFPREGILYNDLSEAEKEEWDAKEWDDEGTTPDRVEAQAVNQWLFNTDTVDKVLEHVMTRGLKVAGGDRIGKTIIFARNQAHAEFIYRRFDANYPHYKGEFARVITFETTYAQSLIDDFSKKDKAPHIAISVDMLDTGIDVPEVVNLVFFKAVRSRTKFWQMVGRGTRLCPELFGPDSHKEFFYIFDYCQNLEFFSQNPEATEGSAGESLGRRLFRARLEMIGALDRGEAPKVDRAAESDADPDAVKLRAETAGILWREVAAMNVSNFVVRPKRRLVEKYGREEAWGELAAEDFTELAREVAGLPSELEAEEEEAKRFDLLILNLQLAVLRAEPAFTRLRDQVKSIAGLLEEKENIPMVRAQILLLQELQTEDWWTGVTAPMLETVRKNLRALVRLLDKKARKPVYTDFVDEIGGGTEMELPGFAPLDTFARFREKARAFLREHREHLSVRRLRMNQPLTPLDLTELERMLCGSGVASPEHIQTARAESEGLGLFVRSLVGLDREAAKRALGDFTAGGTLGANQIEFVNLIVDHLTEHGAMDPGLLYESPFTDLNPQGPEGVFSSGQVDELVAILHAVRESAVA